MRRQSAARLGIALGIFACGWHCPPRVEAQHADRRPQPKIIVYKPQTETEALVGVMGQVPRPGTYQFAGAPTLQLAVDSAGGLTETASPMIRVVRGQRVVLRVALHTAAKETLQPGDLVIVDAQPQKGGQTEPAADVGVQLAFLGVVDRPVIVKVHASQARADRIVQMLGQSPELLRTLRPIPPPNREFDLKTNGAPRSTPLLSDGTVLLFDRRRIEADELRNLPEIIPCSLPEPDIGAYNVRNAYEEKLARELPTSRQSNAAIPWKWNSSPDDGVLSQDPPPHLETSPNASPTLLPDDRIPAMLSSSGRTGNAATPVTTLPFAGAGAISSRASRSTETAPARQAPLAADVREPAWNRVADSKPGQVIDPAIDDSDAEFEDEAASAAGSLSIWHMLTVISCAAILMGLALAIRSLAGIKSAGNRRLHMTGQQTASPPLTQERRQFETRAAVPMPHVPIQAFAGVAGQTHTAGRSQAGERLELRQQRFAQLVNHDLLQIEEPLALQPGLFWSASVTGEITRRPPPLPSVRLTNEAAVAIRQVDPPHPQRVPGPHHRFTNEAPVERALRQLQGGIS